MAAITRPALRDEPYDGALDAFERGMRASRLDDIFDELRAGLVPLLEAINAKKLSNPSIDAPHPALAHGCAQSRKCWFLAYERRTGSRGPVEQGLHEQIHLVPGLPE